MAGGVLCAQAPRPRITSEITSSESATLPGSLHPLARPQNDAGRMPGNSRLNGISIYFNRTAAQQADLNGLLAAQQDPHSPQFHQWLTPEQFAARFGMAQSDTDKVQTWLQQQGFSVDPVARSRNMIRFSGTAAQVESAFRTEMHYYNAAGGRHFAPSTALSVPAAIAPAIAGIRNLHDLRPRPQHVTARAAFTSSQSGSVFFAPPDIATVYDVKPLTSAGINGSGQAIAVVGQSAVSLSDIEHFQSAAGLTKKDPTMTLVPGTGTSTVISGGDEAESDIDLEWAGALATGATINFVYVGSDTNFSVFDSLQYAVEQKLAPIISFSYGSCETELTNADTAVLEGVNQQASAQGQTIIVASGDQGSTACAADTNLSAAQQEAIAVNYPASSAYVTSMGGTAIDQTNTAYLTAGQGYWTAQGSSDIVSSALKYIPEVVWNDDDTQNGISSTGGGASVLVGKPSYQAALTPADGARDVPDISIYSSPNFPGFLFCTSDQSMWNTTQTPAQRASCNSGFRDSSSKDLTIAGGTSFAAPIFAGMLALINQKAGYTNGQGLINPVLYTLAADSSTYESAFHDITSGNNNCTAGPSFCSSTDGFSAGTGYDQVTGLGSLDLANLVAAWPVKGSAALIPTTTTILASNTNPNSGTSVNFTITVTANSTSVPTGTVSVAVDGGTANTQTLDSKGTYTLTTSFTTAGSHQVTASYSGDSTFAASTGGAAVVNIATGSSGKGNFTLGATPPTLTVKQGTSGDETIMVTPGGGYTGTVLLNFSTSNDTALQNLCYAFTTMDNSGQGSAAVTGTAAVTSTFTLDANASDCSSTAGVAKPGLRPLRTLMAGRGTPPQPAPGRLPAEAAFAGLLLAGFLGRYARRFRSAAWVLVLAAAGLALSACSSSSFTLAQNPPKGNYTITVAGADSVTTTNTANTTFTLTIN
jgi:subtilase family serine protease